MLLGHHIRSNSGRGDDGGGGNSVVLNSIDNSLRVDNDAAGNKVALIGEIVGIPDEIAGIPQLSSASDELDFDVTSSLGLTFEASFAGIGLDLDSIDLDAALASPTSEAN